MDKSMIRDGILSAAEAATASKSPQEGETGMLAQIMAEIRAVSGRVTQIETGMEKRPGQSSPSPRRSGNHREEPESSRGRLRGEAVDEKVLSNFRKENPPAFKGGVDPLEAEQWVSQLEHIFYFLGVKEEDKPRLASRQLEGPALDWWKSMRTRRNIEEATWREFIQLFEAEFLPFSVRLERRNKFSRLSQGSRTVSEYEQEFQTLSRFAPETVETKEMRA